MTTRLRKLAEEGCKESAEELLKIGERRGDLVMMVRAIMVMKPDYVNNLIKWVEYKGQNND